MENNKTWLLVAGASNAKIYVMHKARVLREPNNPNTLQLIQEFSHLESRKKAPSFPQTNLVSLIVAHLLKQQHLKCVKLKFLQQI